MKKSVLVLLLTVTSSLLISCGTTGAIPGESKLLRQNIYSEYYNIAETYEGLQKYSKAIDYYVLASSGKEIKAACQYKIARCYALNKDWANAEIKFKELLKKDPQNTSLMNSLAYIHAMNNKPQEAVVLYEKILAQQTADATTFKNYITVLISTENYVEAEKILNLLKDSYPDNESIEKFSKAIEEANKKNEPEEKAPVQES